MRQVYENILPLLAEDVADQIIYATTRPRSGAGGFGFWILGCQDLGS